MLEEGKKWRGSSGTGRVRKKERKNWEGMRGSKRGEVGGERGKWWVMN